MFACDTCIFHLVQIGRIILLSKKFRSAWSFVFQDLEAFVSNALEKASQIGCTSIAFPAIGTGILKYPRDVVARVMLEKILSFGEKNPETTLKDIRLALISSDTATIKVAASFYAFLH